MSLTQQESDESQKQSRGQTQEELALARCNEQIRWYTKAMSCSGWNYRISQGLAVFLGGMTPVLVVLLAIFDSFQNLFLFLIALFPALAAVSTGLNGIFQYRETYIRFGYTVELLKSEKLKYRTRTTRNYHKNLADEEALNNFVRRIESIALKETSDWRSQMNEAMELEEALKLVDEIGASLSKN